MINVPKKESQDFLDAVERHEDKIVFCKDYLLENLISMTCCNVCVCFRDNSTLKIIDMVDNVTLKYRNEKLYTHFLLLFIKHYNFEYSKSNKTFNTIPDIIINREVGLELKKRFYEAKRKENIKPIIHEDGLCFTFKDIIVYAKVDIPQIFFITKDNIAFHSNVDELDMKFLGLKNFSVRKTIDRINSNSDKNKILGYLQKRGYKVEKVDEHGIYFVKIVDRF